MLAGITAISGDLPRRRAAAGDLALDHGQKALGIGGVAGLDDDIEDQAAAAGDQVELVSVLHVVEAGISCLKRAYGLARCTWRGLDTR